MLTFGYWRLAWRDELDMVLAVVECELCDVQDLRDYFRRR